MTKGVYSEYEVKEQYIKVTGEAAYSPMSCVGTAEEELEVKTVSKKCRGVVAKKRTRGTGNGTLKESLHVPYEIYKKLYDMNADSTLAEGVAAYGNDSLHPTFALTMKVLDEDDVVKYKAYPNCTMESGPTRKIENGAEEVAELELTISLLPDDYGKCMYEALEDELDSATKAAWLTSFTPALAHVTTV